MRKWSRKKGVSHASGSLPSLCPPKSYDQAFRGPWLNHLGILPPAHLIEGYFSERRKTIRRTKGVSVRESCSRIEAIWAQAFDCKVNWTVESHEKIYIKSRQNTYLQQNRYYLYDASRKRPLLATIFWYKEKVRIKKKDKYSSGFTFVTERNTQVTRACQLKQRASSKSKLVTSTSSISAS